MRTKEELLKDLGVNAEYSPHGGIPADTKDVILAEILIDIRDALVTDCKDAMNALIEIRKKD